MKRQLTFPRQAAPILRWAAGLFVCANFAVVPAFGQSEYDRLFMEYEQAKAAYDRDSAAFQNEYAAFQWDVQAFTGEAEAFQRQTEQLDRESAPLQSAIEDFERQLNQFNADGKTYESEVQSHNGQVQALEAAYAQYDSAVDTFNSSVAQWEADSARHESAANAHKADLDAVNNLIYGPQWDSLKNEEAALDSAIAAFNSKPEEERTEFEANRINNWIRNYEHHVAVVQAEVERVNARATQLNIEADALDSRNKNLLATQQELERRKQDLLTHSREIDDRKAQLDNQASQLDRRGSELEQDKVTLEQRVVDFQSRYDANERRRQDLLGRQQALQNREDRLSDAKQQLERQRADLVRRLDQLDKLVDDEDVPRGLASKTGDGAKQNAAKARGLKLEPEPKLGTGTTPESGRSDSIAFGQRNGPTSSTGSRLRKLSAPRVPIVPTLDDRGFKLPTLRELSKPATGTAPGVGPRSAGSAKERTSGIADIARIPAAADLSAKSRGWSDNGAPRFASPRPRAAAAAVPKLRGLSGYDDDLDARAEELRRRRAARLARIREIEEQISELESKKATARRELERIIEGAPGIDKALTEWADLAVDARNDALEQSVMTGLSVILADQSIDLIEGKAIKQANLDALQRKVFQTTQPPQEFLEEMPWLLAGIREIKGREQLINFIENSLSGRAMFKAIGKKEYAELLKEVVGLFVQDPRAKAVLADVELVTAVGYAYTAGHFARAEVARLNELTVQQLEQVRIYGGMLRDCTDKINELKRQRGTL